MSFVNQLVILIKLVLMSILCYKRLLMNNSIRNEPFVPPMRLKKSFFQSSETSLSPMTNLLSVLGSSPSAFCVLICRSGSHNVLRDWPLPTADAGPCRPLLMTFTACPSEPPTPASVPLLDTSCKVKSLNSLKLSLCNVLVLPWLYSHCFQTN